MGDLSTHKKIFKDVVYPILRQRLSLTGSETQCFELGNWLRDVSQFRDPYSAQLKKLELFRAKLPSQFKKAIGRDRMKTVLNELLGPHHQYDQGQTIVSGALGEWFRHILISLGLASFRSSGQQLGDQIPESEFLRIFNLYFTQYYPHEHLDFPPSGNAQLLGDWSKGSERTQAPDGPKRMVLSYLDDFIDYVAVQLSQVEFTLKGLLSKRPTDKTDDGSRVKWHENLQEVLVKLGKASHAIEDYYFHSNFTELALLYAALGERAENIELQSFFRVPSVGTLKEAEKRKLFRRVRAPQLDTDKDGNSVLSPSGSEYARYVFTGMFGGDDVLYTFGDAFESIESIGAVDLFVNMLDSTLFKYLLIRSERAKLVKTHGGIVVNDDDAIDAASYRHFQELREGKLVNQAAGVSGMSPLFASSIKRANEVDLGFALLFEKEEDHISIGRVLLTLASNVEAANQNSQRKAAEMDRAPKELHYIASNNSNSAENIGSHTLMAKDSVRKLPLRTQADAFARFAVGTTINILTEQFSLPGRANKFVDWGEFLRRLMCHPGQADWVKKMLAGMPVPKNVIEPKLTSRLEFDIASRDGAGLPARLQQSYYNLYLQAKALWEKELGQ